MTRKQKRLTMILGGLAILGIAFGIIGYVLSSTISFFVTPSQITEQAIQPGQQIRLGGMVKEGSIVKGEGTRTQFVVTDTLAEISVTTDDLLPDLFREGQGVVAEGKIQGDGTFLASEVLAKHDENYMPKQLADSLKEQGVKLGKGAEQ